LYPINISHRGGYFHEEKDQHKSHELLEFESLGLTYFSFCYLCFYMIIRAMMSSSSTPSNPLLAQPTEKLAKANHALWFAQVRTAIRGAKLLGYLTGDSRAPPAIIPKLGADDKEVMDAAGKVIMIKNLDFEDWDATDQQVLSYLLALLSKDVLVQVSSCNTAAEAWAMI
jgi:hypothetical protein